MHMCTFVKCNFIITGRAAGPGGLARIVAVLVMLAGGCRVTGVVPATVSILLPGGGGPGVVMSVLFGRFTVLGFSVRLWSCT